MLKSFKNNNIVSMRKRSGDISIEGKGGVVYSSVSSLDTTLFKNANRPKLKRTKRKIINDRDISPSLFEKLKLKCKKECATLTQKNIIEVLYSLNISNITLARIINDLIPDAKATQGSIASMIRFIKTSQTSKNMANELDKLLDKEL